MYADGFVEARWTACGHADGPPIHGHGLAVRIDPLPDGCQRPIDGHRPAAMKHLGRATREATRGQGLRSRTSGITGNLAWRAPSAVAHRPIIAVGNRHLGKSTGGLGVERRQVVERVSRSAPELEAGTERIDRLASPYVLLGDRPAMRGCA
jgi:hypothetical protein